MTKYIKQRLSVKIFIITFLLLGAACGGTYFFISKLLPTTYSNLINSATEKSAMHLVEQMTSFDNISDCENDISNFSKETNAAFWIEDTWSVALQAADRQLHLKSIILANYIQVALLYYSCPQEGSYNF